MEKVIENHKLVLALLMLLTTMGWAYFTVVATAQAIQNLKVANIMVAAGANGVLGVLTTLTTLVYQHYFRKSKPE